MDFNLQPTLENELIKVIPLEEKDFEALYAVAADPLIWEQHPNKDRYQREVFENFFKGAMESKGAFLVTEKASGKVVGSSRYYDPDPEKRSIAIGYTFIGRGFWGKGHNRTLKLLMLDYAFQFADLAIFHVGAGNLRSQKAIEKLGAKKTGETEVAYYGEPVKPNFIYELHKKDREKLQAEL